MVTAEDLMKGSGTVSCEALANVKITPSDANTIAEAMKNTNNLDTLNLSGISLGIDGAEIISKVIPSSLKYCKWDDMFKGWCIYRIS